MNIILARSERNESTTEGGVYWWTEYRLSYYAERPSGQQYTIERRFLADCEGIVYARVDGKTVRELDPCETWIEWTAKETPELAIDDVIGDTRFLRSESLHQMHAKAVADLLAEREKNQHLYAIKLAQEELEDAKRDFEEWKQKQNACFTAMNQGKEGTEREKAKDRARARLQPVYDRYANSIAEAERILEKLLQKSS